jgi:hypothetical protein
MANPKYKTGGATENSVSRRPTGALHDPSYAATGDREIGFLPGQNCTVNMQAPIAHSVSFAPRRPAPSGGTWDAAFKFGPRST